MTVTVNGHKPAATVRDDVQMCVRAPESGPETADPAGDAQGTTGTRAFPARVIADKITDFKGDATSKIRDVVSLHAGEVLPAVKANATFTERPMTVADAWRQVTPGKGEVGSRLGWTAAAVAGLFRALVLSVLYVAAVSVGTRIRAGVALGLLVAVLSTAGIVSALT